MCGGGLLRCVWGHFKPCLFLMYGLFMLGGVFLIIRQLSFGLSKVVHSYLFVGVVSCARVRWVH